uniref:Cytochrome c oxidase subunit 3 n=1 Tax=Cicadellidae gen. sp. 1 JCX-2018 TaxID=2306300 RepID=A0A346RNJ1_9HEMI|nr:cytochrome c oxidase subunit III [Cicadellidae gen. sp. 1 JCX-2018]
MKSNHPFHLVDYSPWPLLTSLSTFTVMSGMIMWFSKKSLAISTLGTITMVMIMNQWWRDVTRESTMQGMHTNKVLKSMKMGMMLFIMSEILFFMSFFWAFFHSSLSPSIDVGMKWPPLGIKPFNPMNIPMLNTMILLASGISITWAHNSILNKNLTQTIQSMAITIMLGIYFSIIQMIEYWEAPFTIADSVFGSTFFMSTGFHGIHVLVGTIFILISMIRISQLHMSKMHHFGFEAAAWYWHFVDVVWLFLYISIYWWGGV